MITPGSVILIELWIITLKLNKYFSATFWPLLVWRPLSSVSVSSAAQTSVFCMCVGRSGIIWSAHPLWDSKCSSQRPFTWAHLFWLIISIMLYYAFWSFLCFFYSFIFYVIYIWFIDFFFSHIVFNHPNSDSI